MSDDNIRNDDRGENDESMHTIIISEKGNNLQSLEELLGADNMPNSLPYWDIDDYSDPDSYIGMFIFPFISTFNYYCRCQKDDRSIKSPKFRKPFLLSQ